MISFLREKKICEKEEEEKYIVKVNLSVKTKNTKELFASIMSSMT